MNFEEAEKTLRVHAMMSPKEQKEMDAFIAVTFDIFWASNPSQAKFGEACKGLTITPEMLWIMAKHH